MSNTRPMASEAIMVFFRQITINSVKTTGKTSYDVQVRKKVDLE